MNACIFVYAYYRRIKYKGHYYFIYDTKVKDSFYRKSRDQVITGTCMSVKKMVYKRNFSGYSLLVLFI